MFWLLEAELRYFFSSIFRKHARSGPLTRLTRLFLKRGRLILHAAQRIVVNCKRFFTSARLSNLSVRHKLHGLPISIAHRYHDGTSVSSLVERLKEIANMDPSHTAWLLKEGNTLGGMGIQLVPPGNELGFLEEKQKSLKQQSTKHKEYILQQLVHPSYLITGKKFTFRMVLVVASTFPLVAYIMPSSTNTAFHNFTGIESYEDKCTWVSNSHHAKTCSRKNPNVTRARYSSGPRKWEYFCKNVEEWRRSQKSGSAKNDGLSSPYLADNSQVTCDVVLERIAALLRPVLLAGQEDFRLNEGCWLHLGADLTLDEMLHPWLFEMNLKPLYPRSYGMSHGSSLSSREPSHPICCICINLSPSSLLSLLSLSLLLPFFLSSLPLSFPHDFGVARMAPQARTTRWTLQVCMHWACARCHKEACETTRKRW